MSDAISAVGGGYATQIAAAMQALKLSQAQPQMVSALLEAASEQMTEMVENLAEDAGVDTYA